MCSSDLFCGKIPDWLSVFVNSLDLGRFEDVVMKENIVPEIFGIDEAELLFGVVPNDASEPFPLNPKTFFRRVVVGVFGRATRKRRSLRPARIGFGFGIWGAIQND